MDIRVGTIIGYLEVLEMKKVLRGYRALVRCVCGKEFDIQLSSLRKNCKSCGCRRNNSPRRYCGTTKSKNYDNMKFGMLTVLQTHGKNRYGHKLLLCRCDCGNECIVLSNSLVSKRQVSCGCYNRRKKVLADCDLTGQTFGRLTVIRRVVNRGKSLMYECRCQCGNISEKQYSNLVTRATKSCGWCRQYVNGAQVSWKQRQLHYMIGGVLNYPVDRLRIDIAMARYGKKIAIEYDEVFWHRDKKEEDAKRVRRLMDKGWNVVSVVTNNSLPTIEQIHEAINYIRKVKSGTVWYKLNIIGSH